MKINRIQEIAVPTVRKIQSAMTDVIEHFKTKGYVPTLLERTPNFDSFELVRKSASKTGQTCDLAVYSLKRIGSELPSQELSTFRQLSGSKSYSMSRVDYNEKGQCIRRIFDEADPNFENKSLIEYEYEGNKLKKTNEYYTVNGLTYNEEKIANSESENYIEEFNRPETFVRSIVHTGDNYKKILESRITHDYGKETIIKTQLDVETGKPAAIEMKTYDSISEVEPLVVERNCELDPPTGILTKYSYSINGKTYAMFERSLAKRIIHFIDSAGNEYKLERFRTFPTMVDKDGKPIEIAYNTLYKFISSVEVNMPEIMRRSM